MLAGVRSEILTQACQILNPSSSLAEGPQWIHLTPSEGHFQILQTHLMMLIGFRQGANEFIQQAFLETWWHAFRTLHIKEKFPRTMSGTLIVHLVEYGSEYVILCHSTYPFTLHPQMANLHLKETHTECTVMRGRTHFPLWKSVETDPLSLCTTTPFSPPASGRCWANQSHP